MARRGVSVYLPRELQARLQRIAKDQHRSESSIVTDALKARLERGESGKPAEDGDKRQVFRLEARLDKAIGETLILKEMVLLFIRVWLEHNPPIDETLEESAAASAEARFERFLDLVAQALAPGQSLASRELQTSFSANSAAAASQANGEAHT